jgi:hypothetical protein
VFIACIIMIFACGTSFVISNFLRLPNYELNFTTLTRDSAYVPVPPGGSALGDGERGRHMRLMRIRVEDIVPLQSVGQIAIRFLDETADSWEDRSWPFNDRERQYI